MKNLFAGLFKTYKIICTLFPCSIISRFPFAFRSLAQFFSSGDILVGKSPFGIRASALLQTQTCRCLQYFVIPPNFLGKIYRFCIFTKFSLTAFFSLTFCNIFFATFDQDPCGTEPSEMITCLNCCVRRRRRRSSLALSEIMASRTKGDLRIVEAPPVLQALLWRHYQAEESKQKTDYILLMSNVK